MAKPKKQSKADKPVSQSELRALIAAARETLRRNHDPRRHGVGAAVLSRSGKIFTGVNVEACGYGPCAEPIALGAAITAGERHFRAFVAVTREGKRFPVLSPCGNCRQLILDYAPNAVVVFSENGKVKSAPVMKLLPGAYRSGFGKRR